MHLPAGHEWASIQNGLAYVTPRDSLQVLVTGKLFMKQLRLGHTLVTEGERENINTEIILILALCFSTWPLTDILKFSTHHIKSPKIWKYVTYSLL